MTETKSIFITGGGSGIGRAIAERFASEGWFIGLADIDEAGMAETVALLPDGMSSSHKLDVRDRAAWDEALDAFSKAAGGRIDVVANNAGIPVGGDLKDLETDEIDRCLDINLKAVIYGAQAAYPHLKKTAPGSCLLNTASAAALYGSAGMSVYCATKMGVRAVTESLDSEWAEDGIKVRSLMPSFIDTPLLVQSGNRSENSPIRDRVIRSGLEFTPVETVASIAWSAVHGKGLHSVIGKTAKRMAFAAKWTPGKLRQQIRILGRAM